MKRSYMRRFRADGRRDAQPDRLASVLTVAAAVVTLQCASPGLAAPASRHAATDDRVVQVADVKHAAGEHNRKSDHDEHIGHANEGEHGHDEAGIALSPAQQRRFGIETAAAGPGPIAETFERPAEVKFNQDKLAHVVPRVSGIAETVAIAQGDQVEEGQIIAVLDSRELADAKALYLAAVERRQLAQEEFDRQKVLRDKKITSEKLYLAARTALAEAKIAYATATQKLFALGYSKAEIEKFTYDDDATLTKYIIRAPLSGTVITRHLVRGEFVDTEKETERELFTIADVSSVWVDIALYPRDLAAVKKGRVAKLATESGGQAMAPIAFVAPHLTAETRTATARVILDNKDKTFRPGQYVRAFISVDETPVAVRVMSSALQTVDDQTVVFVADRGQFKKRVVQLGRRNQTYAEVMDGLEPGQNVVVNGSYLLKSELAKAGFDDGHNH